MDSITDRFIASYNELKEIGSVGTAYQFCKKIGADRRNFGKLLQDPSRHLLRPEWLGGLVLVYGVSADWLLTGRGFMFGA